MSTAIDEQVVLDVDLDAVVACDVPACQNPAEWALKCRACPHEIVMCSPHRALGDRVHNVHRPRLACDVCALPHLTPLPWRQL